MSRLTSFYKAMPEDIPRPVQLPASPPETELDHLIPQLHDHSPEQATETPASRFRRVASTVSYHHSAAATPRDARQVGPRTSRWLVVVFPPQSLKREPAVLGNTLSTSANGRFNNGILMPLFPTMYGQLTAIAREFGLPSVSGVCIYLHMADAGLAMTPRISDDTWQLLWGHFFDEGTQPQPGMALPISGRIEFDIDVRKARWYHAWIGEQRGETSIPPSVAPSVSMHRKRESRSTLFGDEDARSENGLYPLQLASSRATVTPRPRMLNLVGKNGDSSSQRPAQRDIIVVDDQSPDSEQGVVVSSKRLSPVPQEDEPVTAKLVEADRRVMQWRIASGTTPNPASNKTGQVCLDPANMPNSLPDTPAESKIPVGAVDAVVAEDEDVYELNLDDFAWSISSAGPGSYPGSPVWSEPQLSVHMEWRAQGSVPPTPTTATTNWPYDYPDSPFSVASRLPSPDIAYRMLDDAPCTPTTATSWGPTSWPPSPVHSERYASSVDLGQRMSWSRPATPATATSWGPESYPPSPAFTSTSDIVYTPGVADRSFEIEQRGVHPRAASFPYYSAWTREPWSLVWPYRQPFAQESSKCIAVAALSYPFTHGIYAAVTSGSAVAVMLPGSTGYPFAHGVYPSRQLSSSSTSPVKVMLSDACGYPFTYGIYPARSAGAPVKVMLHGSSGYPFTYGVYPATNAALTLVKVTLPGSSGYPFDHGIYPSTRPSATSRVPVKVMLSASSGYPFKHGVYPAHSTVAPVKVMLSGSTGYPFTNGVYPATRTVLPLVKIMLAGSSGYPFNNGVYPSTHSSVSSRGSVTVMLSASCGYPFDHGVYPQRSTPSAAGAVKLLSPYPFIQEALYPAVYPHNLACIYPTAFRRVQSSQASSASISVRLPSLYPVMDIYPAGYPYSLSFIYPGATEDSAGPLSVRLPSTYPSLTIYESVYPNLDIYPGPSAPNALPERPEQWRVSTSTRLAARWPAMELYSVEYPYFNLYPGAMTTTSSKATTRPRPQVTTPVARHLVPVRLPALYPMIQESLYPAVYPHNLSEIYPQAQPLEAASMFVTLAGYPFTTGIYPAVYPFNLDSIYAPILKADEATSQTLSLQYPFLSGVYPAVYPYSLVTIYPPVQIAADEGLSLKGINCRLYGAYPYLQLYEPQYPHVSPYPETMSLYDDNHSRRSSSPGGTRRRSLTPPRTAHRRDGKTHVPRGSLSRRISTEGAPPVPRIPAHIRTPSTSPASSRPSSLAIVQEADRSTVKRRSPKTHKELHDHYYSAQPQPRRTRKTHAQLHDHYFVEPAVPHVAHELLELLDQFPSPAGSRSSSQSGMELFKLAFPDDAAPIAGSTKAGSPSTPSPTRFSPGHAKRTSVVFEKIKQFSPVDDAATPSLSRSSSSSKPRPVSKLDRSKYPFA
ncbi:hypothetical protein EXIGLDRAFT_716031 [Exidia glandulosa HHB12029]|uniref:Uncharacterized protein n=1 Tax=Exidia glandulosa HHB12029 TaxID=1314781 RepID=A0A165QSG2_EXIGL|nr:hypothetical protein EXIGLDRAFT_716031 [Exidia glandulosa HHB12029]